MKKYIFLFILILLLFGFLGSMTGSKMMPENIRYVTLANQKIKVDLAISPEAQSRGLSGRSGLAEGEGMLFIFGTPGKHLFWMQDMKFPIDIIWLGVDGEVVHIQENVRPDSYPETFGAGAYSKYVLEVPAGFAGKYGLRVGNRAIFTD